MFTNFAKRLTRYSILNNYNVEATSEGNSVTLKTLSGIELETLTKAEGETISGFLDRAEREYERLAWTARGW